MKTWRITIEIDNPHCDVLVQCAIFVTCYTLARVGKDIFADTAMIEIDGEIIEIEEIESETK